MSTYISYMIRRISDIGWEEMEPRSLAEASFLFPLTFISRERIDNPFRQTLFHTYIIMMAFSES